MKTHSTHARVTRELTFADHASKLLVICGAIALCVASTAIASGQSPLQAGSSGVANGLFTHGSEAFRVVDTAGYKTAGDVGVTQPGTIQQVGYYESCSSCGTSCGGTCGGRVSGLSCNAALGGACTPCSPYSYVSVEALYMNADADSFTLSQNFGMGDFDYQFGSRITFGSVGDCVHGYEMSFTGPFEWDRTGRRQNLAGGLNSFLTTGSPATPISSFTNAILQQQTHTADYWSLEASKTLVGWEMAKLLVGGRYINYDENYDFFSQTTTQIGRLVSDVQNQMFGLQVGMDLLYPISRHAYSDVRARAGAFLNMVDSNVTVVNNGTVLANAGDSSNELAGMFEFGSGVRYQLGQILSVRAGVELWYLSGVATATDQFGSQINTNTGRSTRADQDVLFTGLSVGAELRY